MPHFFQPVEVPFTLEESRELDYPLEEIESLLFGFSVMLDQLILRADARVFALASITVTLQLDGGGIHTRTVSPRVPTNDKQLWLKLLRLDLEAHAPQAAILGVFLSAEPGATNKVQLGLFSPQFPEPGRLDVTLARIAALVGEGNVGQAVLDDTNRLDAFHIKPFSLPACDSITLASPQPKTCIRQLRPPERVLVTMVNGTPYQLYFRDRRYKVEYAYGPWLMGGDWWTDVTWGQEQWEIIAGVGDGNLLYCCVTHDLIQNLWQMAAFYD
jgi:protein ImuB